MITESITTDAQQVPGELADASLNGVVFQMVTSTTSAVDPEAPTRFTYNEEHDVVWGEYTGDTVVVGRFAGIREGNLVKLSYNHRSVSGAITHGNAESLISRDADGKLYLTEFYASADGPQVSVCVEVVAL